MSKVKKGFAISVVLLLIVVVVYAGQMFMINNHNFYALEANSVEEANNALKDMDILEERSFETKDFYGEYVPGTSFVISYQGRVYYDQGYYMVYKGDYKPVYCIDPLKTAWSVTNKGDLDEMNNHDFANLTSYQQDQVSRLILATQYLYDTTNEPEYLVAGQLLVWQAIGSILENYSYNLQEEMDAISTKAAAFDFSDVARGSTVDEDDLIYYDTDGQDLIGTPTDSGDGVCDEDDPTDVDCDDNGGDGVCDEDDPTDVDCDEGFEEGDIEVVKTAQLDDKSDIENGQDVTYSVVVTNKSNETMDFVFTDILSDENLSYVDTDTLVVNGLSTELTVADLQDGFLVQGLTAGDSVKIEYTVTVDLSETYEEGEAITNTAEACIDDTEICDEDIETIGSGSIIGETGLAVEKTIEEVSGNNIVEEGEELTFKILVSNNGEEDLNPVVKDALNDVNVIYDLDSPVYIDGEKSENVIGDLGDDGIILSTLAPGEESEITFTVNVVDDFIFDTDSELLVSNQSEVCVNEECLEADAYLPVGGFKVEKTVADANGNGVAEPNELLTYNIKVENYNSEVSDIVLNDNMSTSLIAYDPNTMLEITPEQTTMPSPATLGSLESGLTLKDVAPGEVINISYSVKVLDDIETSGSGIGNYHISNNVKVCNGEDCIDDSASITIDPNNPVIDGGDKAVVKSISDANNNGVAEPGEKLTFDVLITNGTDVDSSFVITDPLSDPNIEYTLTDSLVVSPGSTGNFVTGTATVGDLQTGVSVMVNANSSFEFTFKASVKDPLEKLSSSYVHNSVQACSTEGCTTGGGKLPLDSTTAFEIKKTVTDAGEDNVVDENEEFEYEIVVTNSGNSDSSFYLQDLMDDQNVNVDIDLEQSLEVDLPEGATMSEENPSLSDLVVNTSIMANESIDENTEGIKVSDVGPGKSVVFKFSGTGISNMIDGSYIVSNTAKVMWESNTGTGVDYASASIYTNEEGDGINQDVAVKKISTDESGDGIVSEGEKVNYAIAISNVSNSDIDVELTDIFTDPNMFYDLEDKFSLTSSDGSATVTSKTLESLNTGITVTVGANSTAYIKYSAVATTPAVDSSATYDYNMVNYCVDEICNSTISYLPREGKVAFDVTKTALKGGSEIQNVTDGENITYEIVVSNTGNKKINEFTLTDFKDDNINIDDTAIISVVDENDTKLSTTPETVRFSNLLNGNFVINGLEVGQQAIIDIPAKISYDEYSNENALITNIVKVCDEDGTCKVDDATVSADITKPVEPGALGVVKQIIEDDPSDGIGTPGEGLTFKVTISNSYNESKIVTIQDSLDDPNLVYDESSTLLISPDDLTGYTIGDLKTGFEYEVPAKSSIQLEFKASIASGEEFDNTAIEVTNVLTACDSSGICSEGGGHLVLPSSAGFALNKTVKVNGVDTNVVALGDNLTYDVSIKNIKNTPITDVIVKDLNSQFIEVPNQPLTVLDADGNTVKTATTDELMSSTGIMIEGELAAGSEYTFTYNANVVTDLHGSTVRHLTNVVAAKSNEIETSRGNSIDFVDGSMIAVDATSLTLDDTYPTTDKFSIVKTVTEEIPDGIAGSGEKLTYSIYIVNLTEDNKTLSLVDTPDANVDYSSSSLSFINIPTNGIFPSSPTIDNLFDGTLTVTVPAMQLSRVSYTGEVKTPLEDPSANYIYNNVEACTLDGECSDTGTETPLEVTKGFDLTKSVGIKGKSGNVVEEGDVLDYTITISNNRNSALNDVVVKDIIDSNIPVDPSSKYDITNSSGGNVNVTPSSERISDLLSEDGITISEIQPGDVITIEFTTRPFGSDLESLSYKNLTNIVNACVPNEAESGERNQTVEGDNGLCASDSATVTTDGSEPPVDGLGIMKEVTETDADGNSNGVAEPGDGLHFKITISNNTNVDDAMILTDLLDDPNIVYDLNQSLNINPSDAETYPSSPSVGDLPTGVEITVNSGDIVTIEFDGTVANPLVDTTASSVSNEIEVCTSGGDCGDGGGNIILPGTNGFDVQKTVAINGVNPVNPEDYVVHNNDNLIYTISLTNNRNTPLQNVVVTDVIDDSILVNLPQKLYIDGVQSEHTAQELFDGTLTFDTLEVGQTIVIEYSATARSNIEDETVKDYTNFVKACSPLERGQATATDDGLCGYDSITVTTDSDGIIDPEGHIGVVKLLKQDESDTSTEPDKINPGELLTFDVLIYNNTTLDQNIILTDALADNNIDYDSVLVNSLAVTPSTSLVNPTNATLGDLTSGITLAVPAQSYVTVEYKANVKDPLANTSATMVGNTVKACLEDGTGCSDSGTDGNLVGNENFLLTKKGYHNGTEVTNSDLIADGEKVNYEVTLQNTGNTPIENIVFTDFQDDNLVVDYTDTLGFDSTLTTQSGFDMSVLTPANPTLNDLFVDRTSTGITIPVLDPGSSITFTYEATVNIVTGSELEATNIVLACSPSDVSTKGSAILDPTTNELCATDYVKVQLKDHISKDPEIGVIKFAIDSGIAGVKDGYVDPGEGIDYYIIVVNKSAEEVEYNLSDSLNDNFIYDLADSVTVSPSSYLVTPDPTMEDLKNGDLKIKIPAYKLAEVKYHVELKDVDSGLDTIMSEVSNEIQVCRTDDANSCGDGESHIPVSSEKYVGITKEVSSLNNLDSDADGILDVINEEALTYTLTVTNKGNTTTDIRVSDDIPDDYLDVIGATPISPTSGYETDPASVTVSDLVGEGIIVKNVLPGDSFKLTFMANVKTADQMLINGSDYSGYITNIAEACTETNLRSGEKCSTTDVSVEYNSPTYPIIPSFTIDKDITDEKGNDDGIAQTGELLTFDIKLINNGMDTANYLITDEFEDFNVDYTASNMNELTKVAGTGEFVGNHLVSDLMDNAATPTIQEGVEVSVDPNQYIEFTFDAYVLDPLTEELKYNSDIVNTVYASDVDGNINYAQSNIDLPMYNRMDITKTYRTDYTYDLDPNPSVTDNIYYITGPNDNVHYEVNYKNIGTNTISNFEIIDYLDESAYTYDPTTEVTLTTPSNVEYITLDQLIYGYVYTGNLEPNETLTASFDVVTRDSLAEKEDGYNIPNIAKVCYDNTYTEEITDKTCKVSGVQIPVDTDGVIEKPTNEFTVEKWIEDDNGLLAINEDVVMHILISNNTDSELSQFNPDGIDKQIEITDDLTDPNFVYDLSTPLNLKNITNDVDVTNNVDVVNKPNATLKDIDSSDTGTHLKLTIKDGEGIEITFTAKGASQIV